ncbi:helix-turn-helix transcriptional regulator [Heyndrickxia ginsengihumi]|uniref:helix-turn-helix transcriptional regulator n=1 Tax=Heyndrickxia ginsengihumi TaxID=363870 RepID=UPI0004703558|nr:helix-turn-helix transcriptional regulator [Heyndrickxia ginsengihumi]
MNQFLIKQRAVIKLYLITFIEKKKMYGTQFLEEIQSQCNQYGFSPSQPEIYKALHDLYKDGIVTRKNQLKGDEGFQEVVIYQFTNDGYEKAKLYKQQIKADLDRSQDLLRKIIKDNYR